MTNSAALQQATLHGPPGDASADVISAFRQAIGEDRPPADVAPQALRSALGIPNTETSELKLTSEQNSQLENGLRLLLQELVQGAASAAVPVLQYREESGGAVNSGMDSMQDLNSAPAGVGFDMNLDLNEGAAAGEEAEDKQTNSQPASTAHSRPQPPTEDSGEEDPWAGGTVVRLLDTVLYLCRTGQVEGGLVLQLLEDLLESSVIGDCKHVFGYIEANQRWLARDPILVRGKLILLRACNQLVRRVSKANDLVFCGRILMLLAFLFPIAEKSAVNFRGAFNQANKTVYQAASPAAPDTTSSTPPAFDFKFYSTFWSLQDFFCNPPSAAAKWDVFSDSIQAVLATFAAQPLAEGHNADVASVSGDLGSFNVKYLTSPNLMGLELKDHNFRRHVLLQCLFVLDYLTLPPSSSQGRQDRGREREREEKRAALLNQVKVLQEEVRRLLAVNPPKAQEFLETVSRVMTREQNWVQWKKEGCPPFDKPPGKMLTTADHEAAEKQRQADAAERQRQAQAAEAGPLAGGGRGARVPRRVPPGTREPGKPKRSMMGNKELDELFSWAQKHKSVLTDPDSVLVPRFREFISPLASDMDPKEGVEEDLHRKTDRVFCWRALRLAARQDVEAFNRFDPTNGIEMVVPPDMLVEEVRTKLHKKVPGASTPPAVRQKRDPAASEGNRSTGSPGKGLPSDADKGTPMDVAGDGQVKEEAGGVHAGSAKKRNRPDE